VAEKAAARQGQRKGDFLAGKYLLGDCIGIGGMGEVYRATNVSLGRDVAVKILSKEFVDNEDDVLRFLREARAAALVRHPHVVDVLDVARDDDGTPFIVQEFLGGEDLERYLNSRGGRLAPEEALEIMIPVADAVAAAHQREVIHRDLKPANIFLSRDGNKIIPKVLDFGASRYATVGDLSAKELRMLIGTPHYMAPEQIISKTDVDARADVWALGIILYELLVGETPFEAETANAVLQLVKTREVPQLSKSLKGASKDLEDLIASCTKRDKTARLANATKVHEAMKEVRDRLKGSGRARVMETLAEIDAEDIQKKVAEAEKEKESVHNKKTPELPANTRVPSLFLPETPRAPDLKPGKPPPPKPSPGKVTPGKMTPPAAQRSRLLTLSSPGSDPPPGDLDLDLEPVPASVPASASRPIEAAAKAPKISARGQEEFGEFPLDSLSSDDAAEEPSPRSAKSNLSIDSRRGGNDSLPPRGQRDFDRSFEDDTASDGKVDLDLDGPPSSRAKSASKSSIPPVLDPGRVGGGASPPARATASVRPPAPGAEPRESRESRISSPTGMSMPTPGTSMKTSGHHRSPRAESSDEEELKPLPAGAKITLAAAIISPAVLVFVALRIVHLTAALGRAMRGDSMVASGVLTVIVLIAAGYFSLKSVQGTRERTLFVATAGMVLFGIGMIITTMTAGEPVEPGESVHVGIAAWVAPIAPLAGAFWATMKARAFWQSKYEGRERAMWAALASFLVLLALELGPLGAARSDARPSATTTSSP
jgi:eukaryotic-like serine/threonine-protein kinase